MTGKLIVAGVSIGQIHDVPLRTIWALKDAEYIITESIPATKHLMELLNIKTNAEMIEYLPWFDEPGVNKNQHIVEDIVDKLKNGSNMVLVSTEGMPLIHDPGYEILLEVRRYNLPVTVIPGPSAPIAALNVSGLDSWKFNFESDMPIDKIEKQDALRKVKQADRTSIFFEKDHNLLDTLINSVSLISPIRPACVCINLTMKDEQVIRGTLQELLDWFSNNDFIGEYEEQKRMVLLIAGTNYYGNENESLY